MADTSRLMRFKRDAVTVVAANIRAFDNTLADRHTIISCDDGLRFDIFWSHWCYMHLCGLKCNIPQTEYKDGRHPKEADWFYRTALSGRLSPRDICCSAGERLMKRKTEVLPLLNRLPDLDLTVVETGKQELYLAIGDRRFAVGTLISEKDSPYVPGEKTLLPRTLRQQDVRRLAADGTAIRRVVDIVVRP